MKITKHSDQSGVDTMKTPSEGDNHQYILLKKYTGSEGGGLKEE